MKLLSETSSLASYQNKVAPGVPLLYLFLLFPVIFFAETSGAQIVGTPDSISVALEPRYDLVGKGHRFWFGEGYRKLWASPVKLKVFDFDKTKGGITIQKTGGGMQTKSLHYRDANGKEWVLRSVQKYPERKLSVELRKTILRNILHDQVITSHPYGAITVPEFAKALGILHSTPQYVFMPDDPALGEYREEFRNMVLLRDERAPEDTVTTHSTEKLQEKLQEDNDYSFDQKLVLRARLLDMLLGDWDRHEDQWRWQKRKEGDKTIYLPIPRDRDNVYYNTTGVLPWLVSHQWLMARLQGFKDRIRDVDEFNFINQFFDRFFLNSLDEEDWKDQIDFVQKTITDDVIKKALRLMPDPIYQLSEGEIERKLKTRRENLQEVALSYYRFLSKNVDISTSDKHELFDVQYKEKGKLDLTIYKTNKTHTRQEMIFHRQFDPEVTKELRLYGLGGQDVFSTSGNISSSIKVRMIGGNDADSFRVNDNTKNLKRTIIYDRSDQPNSYPVNGTKLKTSVDSSVNAFDKRSFRYDRTGPLVSVFVNMDFGALTSLGWIREKQGFRKEPYASLQQLVVNYSTGRKSFTIRYDGDFKSVLGKYDLLVNVLSLGPENVSNFFGVGNETEFINPGREGINYYRSRYDLVNADVRIRKSFVKGFSWNGGLSAQYYTSYQAANEDRFLGLYAKKNPSENVFSNRFYAGVSVGLEWQNLKRAGLYAHGFQFAADIKSMTQLNGESQSFALVRSAFTVNLPLTSNSRIVFMNRVGGGTSFGSPNFYQMMQLGGVQNLRAFNSRRFTGNSMLFDNLELTAKLFDFSSFLFPGSVGIIGFNDLGRVWVNGEQSKQWHHGYGGGIYLAPADLVLLRLLVGHSVETTQIYFNLGYSF
jgi:hypothetical protein